MMRTMTTAAGILIVTGACAWGHDNKDDLKLLDGTWQPV